MKIAFFGQRKYFDYSLIGGFQSYIRRLALGLARMGHEVDYILYDAPQEKVLRAAPGVSLSYCQTFNDGLAKLLQMDYHHVFRVWLPRQDRLKYLWATRRNGSRTRWHNCYLAWPDSPFKRRIVILESCLASGRGKVVCVSPRQYRALRKHIDNLCLVMPLVPADYFLSPEKKSRNDRLNVTFLGNLTRDKYIAEVIALFEKMRGDSRFRFSICGTHDRSNRESAEMHHRLQRQQEINYVHVNMEGYTPDIDSLVKKVLRQTDIFVQPYRTLKNTLDAPLLLLEAMASLCAVITTPLGSVSEIYGESPFLLSAESFPEQAENLLTSLTWERLLAERNRIYARTRELRFHQAGVLENMRAALES